MALISIAIILGLVSMDEINILPVMVETTFDLIAISPLLVAFRMIFWVYSEARLELWASWQKIGDLFVSVIQTIIGLPPVLGGALVSATILVTENDKLESQQEERVYLNLCEQSRLYSPYVNYVT